MSFERRQYSGTASTTSTLSGSISGAATSFSISDATGWPDGSVGPFFATIERNKPGEEHVKCLSRLGTVVTVAPGGRGADGTSAISHSAGVSVEHTISKTDLDETNQHYADTSLDHHSQYFNVARHDVQARHHGGASIPIDVPAASAPADTQSLGASTSLAPADHRHAREAHTLAQHGVGVGWAVGLVGDISSVTFGAAAAAGATGRAADAAHVHAHATAQQVQDTIIPAGVIVPFAGAAAPTGWLICDGSSVLRATYPALFTAIGTTYGSVDGTHFTLPNLKGRVPVGLDAGQAEFDALGETGGEKTHVLTTGEMPSHNHTQDAHGHGITDPGHKHAIDGDIGNRVIVTVPGPQANSLAGAATPGVAPTDIDVNTTGVTANNATATNQATGGGAAHNNLPPYMALTFIIKAA